MSRLPRPTHGAPFPPLPIHVLPQRGAEALEPDAGTLCISIGDPGRDPAALQRGYLAVLRLAFDDIDVPRSPSDVPLTPEQAAAATTFVQAHHSKASLVLVHCVAGTSRSPGVALGLADAFGWPTAELAADYPRHNRSVREAVARAGHAVLGTTPHRPWYGPCRLWS